jgi:hypothetical protein
MRNSETADHTPTGNVGALLLHRLPLRDEAEPAGRTVQHVYFLRLNLAQMSRDPSSSACMNISYDFLCFVSFLKGLIAILGPQGIHYNSIY